jgi:hypothetical protein
MFHRGHFVLRILGALLLIGVMIAGGALLFRAGQAQGYALGAATAANQIAAPNANGAPAPNGVMPGPFYPRGPYGYGYSYGFGPHFMPLFFPFGFFGIGLFVLFLFLIGGVFRIFAFRRHMMWHRHPEGWDGPWGPGMRHGEPGTPQAKPADPNAPKDAPTGTPQS